MAASPNQQPSTSTAPSAPVPISISADYIDTLPVLAALLSRLQSSPSTSSTAGSPPAASPSQLAAGTGPLTIKDIPTATDDLKHKLRRARTQVKEFPDMQRTLEEQELEIRELEEKIDKQKSVLKGLRDRDASAGDRLMEGMERTEAQSMQT